MPTPHNERTIGRYKIVQQIGEGGMGVVYLAHDPAIDRLVVIKCLREGLDNDDLRERFAREARTAGRLRHPNIVTIFDVGEDEGRPFLAMEYLPGETLAELIRRRAPLPVPRRLALIESVCDGLAYAHKAGMVHRDIKPANVMIDSEGGVKILDFGIVRVAGSGMTQSGMLVGTLNYMSPEQVSGASVDHRSDVFAVGTVAYELLSYKQAFPGSLQDGILHRVMHESPVPLEQLCPTLDPAVPPVVARALEKDAGRRYQDLIAMRRDLQRIRERLEEDEETGRELPSEDLEETRVVAPPTPARPGPTPAADRDAMARRRAEMISSHLSRAESAIQAQEFEAAVAAAEQALMLDPVNTRANQLFDHAREAIEEREIRRLLDSAKAELEHGDLTRASEIVDQILARRPAQPDAKNLKARVRERRLEQERARERARLVRMALDRARANLAAEAYEASIRAADEVLALQPGEEDARAIRQRAVAAIAERERREEEERRREEQRRLEEARRREEERRLEEVRRVREARIEQALADARAQRDHEVALARLGEALKQDPGEARLQDEIAVRQRLRERQREEERAAAEAARREQERLAREAEEARRRREEEERLARAAEAARRTREEEERRAREAEAARQRAAREREERIARALGETRTIADHAAAISALTQALKQDPDERRLQDEIGSRQRLLERQREEERAAAEAARREQERLAREAEEARRKREEEERAFAAEQARRKREEEEHRRREEEERQAREAEAARQAAARQREERITGALEEASAIADHAAAIAVLARALKVARDEARLQQALGARQALLDRQREEERAAADAARQERERLAREADEARRKREEEERQAREAEAARQAALRAREEQIGRALTKARKTRDHQAALALLNSALQLDPGNARVQDEIRSREALLARQREQERQAALDAEAARVERERAARQAEEARLRREEERRARDAEKARQRQEEKDRRAREAAEARLKREEEARQKGVLKPKGPLDRVDWRSPAVRTAAALLAVTVLAVLLWTLRSPGSNEETAAPSTAPSTDSGAPPPRDPLVDAEAQYAQGQADLAIKTAIDGYGRTSDSRLAEFLERVRASAAAQATSVRKEAEGTDAATLPPFAEAARAEQEAAQLTAPGETARAVELYRNAEQLYRRAVTASSSDPGLFARKAEEQYKRGAIDAALDYLLRAIALDPKHRAALSLQRRIRGDALQRTTSARNAARGAGAAESQQFRDAEAKLQQANRLSAAGSLKQQIDAFGEAERLYKGAEDTATREAAARRAQVTDHITRARTLLAQGNLQQADAEVSRALQIEAGNDTARALKTQIDDARRAQTMAQQRAEPIDERSKPVDAKPTPAPPPAAPATPETRTQPQPQPASPGSGSPAASPGIDTAGIDRAIRAYESAFNRLDAAAVTRVAPFLEQEQGTLAKRFSSYDSQTLNLTCDPPQVDAARATASVSCQGTISVNPKGARAQSTPLRPTFQLERTTGEWLITGIRYR